VAIDEPRTVHYTPPERGESTLDCRFSREALHHAPATFCAAVPHGRVWGTGGAVISPDNRLLADVSEELGLFTGHPRNHSLFRQWKLPAVQFVKGSIAVLASSGGWNYFHWMFDSLPRLGLLRAAFPERKVDLYLVNRPLSPFQLETLGGLGTSRNDVKICEASTFIEAEELLLPSLPGLSGFVSRRSCDFLRRHFGAPQKANGQGGVLTMGVMKGDDISLNARGEFTLRDGVVVPVLHQYDRHPSVIAAIHEKLAAIEESGFQSNGVSAQP
jgi:hypothetical protein